MKLTRNFLLFVGIFFFAIKGYSQESFDTVAKARELAYSKDFKASDTLLSLYNNSQPDQHSLHLHAQVLYWMKQFDRSIQTFEKAVTSYPEASTIKLDYARVLYETGNYKKAEQQFIMYLPYDDKNLEAALALANINLWNRNIVEARKRANIILNDYPANEAAQNILSQINTFYSPYITANYGYLSDDQPVRGNGIVLETGWFSSQAFAPAISFQLNNFSSVQPGTSIQSGISNNFYFNYGKTNFTAGVGIFKPGTDKVFLTGLVNLSQRVSGALSISMSAEKRPYQYTLASIENPFTFTNISLGIDLNKNNKFLGRAGVERQSFTGNNAHTVYMWALLPVIHSASVSLHGGYAFSYANSKFNTFRSNKSLSSIVATQPVLGQLKGIYDPYFTPQNQLINSALASLRVTLSKNSSLNIRGSVGFYATADNPVLLLEQDADTQYLISKSYYNEKYTPFEFETNLQLRLSDKVNLHTLYNYTKLFFYNRHLGSIRLTYRFTNAKK